MKQCFSLNDIWSKSFSAKYKSSFTVCKFNPSTCLVVSIHHLSWHLLMGVAFGQYNPLTIWGIEKICCCRLIHPTQEKRCGDEWKYLVGWKVIKCVCKVDWPQQNENSLDAIGCSEVEILLRLLAEGDGQLFCWEDNKSWFLPIVRTSKDWDVGQS